MPLRLPVSTRPNLSWTEAAAVIKMIATIARGFDVFTFQDVPWRAFVMMSATKSPPGVRRQLRVYGAARSGER